MTAFDQVYADWRADPEAFWLKAAQVIDWVSPPTRALDDSTPPFYRWYPGAELNMAANCLDRHVAAGHGERTALIYDSPVTGTICRYSYRELTEAVARLAGALAARGITKGDRVVVYMPMVAEALMAMLACARLGAVHSVVFGGFAARELAVRIDDAKPKAILSASCGIEAGRVIAYKPLLDAAIELASAKPDFCLILARPQQDAALIPGRDLDWAAAVAAAEPAAPVTVAASDPLYILYTSGTTGVPKGVVHDNGGYAVALSWTMTHLYGIGPGETMFTASDMGWAVGHSYIVYGPLLVGATTIVYEGKPVGTPDAGAFWRVIADHGAKALFCAPTALRAIKRDDPQGQWVTAAAKACLKTLFLAGERADPDTVQWAEKLLGRPVVDHWWQTETGWAIAGNCTAFGLLPVKYGSTAKPMPGYDVQILDDHGKQLPAGQTGAIAIALPLPPGTLTSLWQNDQGFVKSYLADYPGYYRTGDAGFIDEDGYIFVMSRTDDIINVAGHRLSTGGIEEVLASHPDVAECAVIGAADQLKGQIPLGFVVLKAGVSKSDEQVEREIIALVRDKIGPVASFKTVTVVKRLPKTRSGKILRGTMRKIADDVPWTAPATIDDPAILDEIASALSGIGYGGGGRS